MMLIFHVLSLFKVQKCHRYKLFMDISGQIRTTVKTDVFMDDIRQLESREWTLVDGNTILTHLSVIGLAPC